MIVGCKMLFLLFFKCRGMVFVKNEGFERFNYKIENFLIV